jgi:hypothetical protein
VVFKSLRERLKTTGAEESELLGWLLEEIPERNPWKGTLTALRDSKRRAPAESVPDRIDETASAEELLKHKKDQDEEDLDREFNRFTRSAQKEKIKKKILLAPLEALGLDEEDTMEKKSLVLI